MATKATQVHEKFGGAPHSKQSLRLWLRLLTCTTLIENTIRNRLRQEFDTTLPRFDVLSALERNPEGLTMGELSRFLMVSNGNVTGLVTRLEADGLISRTVSPTDKRTYTVKLTEQGTDVFAAMAKAHEGWVDEMFADISDEEAALLLEHLNHVRRSLARGGIRKNS